MARYAVRLSDLQAFCQRHHAVCWVLFGDILRAGDVVCVEETAVDGYAAVLHCEDERALALSWVCRKKAGWSKPVRFYVEGPDGVWSPVGKRHNKRKKEVQDGG
ncbi:MAG: hypothetical protein ACUVS5_12840 [Anaerolineae bacterium]